MRPLSLSPYTRNGDDDDDDVHSNSSSTGVFWGLFFLLCFISMKVSSPSYNRDVTGLVCNAFFLLLLCMSEFVDRGLGHLEVNE